MMESSRAKRRKTSPATSIPISNNAPATPSRIPINTPKSHLSSHPSFASPTKASLSRHNPQLLNRPSTSSKDTRTAELGRNPHDVSASVLGESSHAPLSSTEDIPSWRRLDDPLHTQSARQENDPKEIERAILDARSPTRSIDGHTKGKPRSMSRSPVKRTDMLVMGGEDNPFAKRGLRRTPPPLSEMMEENVRDEADSFKNKSLRRSSIAVVQSESPLGVSGKEKISGSQESPTFTEVLPVRDEGLRMSLGSISPGQDIVGERQIQRDTASISPNFESRTRKIEQSKSPRPSPPTVQTIKDARLEHLLKSSPTLTSAETVRENFGQEVPVHISPRSAQTSLPTGFEGLSPSLKSQPVERSDQLLEPGLPPTPKHRGIPDPVVTTPLLDIYSPFSKRTQSSKELSGNLKSSSLQLHSLKRDSNKIPSDILVEQETEASPEMQAPRPSPAPQPQLTQPHPKLRRSSRFPSQPDAYAVKRKKRDDLLRELKQLHEDLDLAKAENERLRLRDGIPTVSKLREAKQEDVIAMLIRATAPTKITAKKEESIFKKIDAFLPFAPRRRCGGFGPEDAALLKGGISSHDPLSISNPLPYLQAFTPLCWSSSMTIIRSPQELAGREQEGEIEGKEIGEAEIDDQNILQQHTITATHRHGLFSARLALTVHAASLTVQQVSILHVPMCAEQELGTFIRAGREVGVVCYAMGRWLNVSLRRARFWCDVERAFGGVGVRSRRKKGKENIDSVTESDDYHAGRKPVSLTKKDLLAHLGRSSMCLSSSDSTSGADPIELLFEWHLSFDWTGEVESRLDASSRLPLGWYSVDSRHRLPLIPALFRNLLVEKGPFGAVAAIVSLVFSSA